MSKHFYFPTSRVAFPVRLAVVALNTSGPVTTPPAPEPTLISTTAVITAFNDSTFDRQTSFGLAEPKPRQPFYAAVSKSRNKS